MAAGTNVAVRCGRQQFQGLFEDVMVLEFTLDTGSINSNTTAEDTVSAPGLSFSSCIVLGWAYGTEPSHDLLHEVHAATNALHILTHNNSGGAVNPASSRWQVVIAKLRTP